MARVSLTRRSVLRGCAAVLVGGIAGFLVARGSRVDEPAADAAAANQYGPRSGPGGQRLVELDAVPSGGALVVEGAGVVVLREGERVRAFSSTCTHQGCTIIGLDGGTLSCPCHGSRFDPVTGDPVAGPAIEPLAEVAVEVRAGSVWMS